MWGSRPDPGCPCPSKRSIPTCVGQPTIWAGDGEYCRVYPHVCGAATSGSYIRTGLGGLSPRVWGSPAAHGRHIVRVRSIPTCVGQPGPGERAARSGPVYPHVCGAASCGRAGDRRGRGLSPRVWGSQRGRGSNKRTAGSIPTCVGQPSWLSFCKPFRKVYPHVCGAANPTRRTIIRHRGLSPRVWGSQDLTDCLGKCIRSIPTCVGQPSLSGLNRRMHRVYPHVCGAANGGKSISGLPYGLSPRVWGSPQHHSRLDKCQGSIPTCVGQPQARAMPIPMCVVYPHVCGAAWLMMTLAVSASGLSPRVWGSLNIATTDYNVTRSIPTCVGQPTT